MMTRAAKRCWQVGTVVLCLLVAAPLWAQGTLATISGTITDSSGQAISNATVSVDNLTSGQMKETQTGADGRYNMTSLTPGDYEITVRAQGFSTREDRVTLQAGASGTMDLVLDALSNGEGPSLQSLGFPSSATQGSAREQALLNKRSHMLQIHQKLGMLTAIPMVAMLFTGPGAKGHHGLPGSASGRNLHMGLGILTSGMYWTTAYYAIRAPKIPGTKSYGLIRLHKILAWVHGPGMIITPILGAIAYSQLNRGERIHGIAKYHSVAAYTTAIAYGAALLSVSFK
ncbi:MAG TPA: carboxypeptidase-like regulatory domain-containing protein [Terriglobia bacterium]|nr:carboxypeptidase-like regulatory domain-containing protein [Terriglobia bacterium]